MPKKKTVLLSEQAYFQNKLEFQREMRYDGRNGEILFLAAPKQHE